MVFMRSLLCKFREVGLLHVARSVKLFVECEGSLEGVRRVSAFAQLQVVAEQRTVGRVCAVLYDEFGALQRILSAEGGDTLVGDEHSHRVLAVVEV